MGGGYRGREKEWGRKERERGMGREGEMDGERETQTDTEKQIEKQADRQKSNSI